VRVGEGQSPQDDVTSIIMIDWKTGKTQVLAKGAKYRDT
jgi:hypothetical protein